MFTKKKTSVEVIANPSKIENSVSKYFENVKDNSDIGEQKRQQHQKLNQKYKKKHAGVGSDKLSKEAKIAQESSKEGSNTELKKKILQKKKKRNQKFVDYGEDEEEESKTEEPTEKKKEKKQQQELSDDELLNSKSKLTKSRKMREKLKQVQKIRKDLYNDKK